MKTIYEGKIFTIEHDETRKYDYVRMHQNAVVIIGVDEITGHICTIDEYRPALDLRKQGLPAGKIDDNETWVEAAVREFKEETGYTLQNVELIHEYYPAAGYSNEKIYMVLGDFISRERVEVRLDGGEEIYGTALLSKTLFTELKVPSASFIIAQYFVKNLL